MDQNQTIDNDLQKAIDDITNNTNIDPVFSDPIAAPSSIPENDTGELTDPVGPFTNPAMDNTFMQEPTLSAPTFDSSTLPIPDPAPQPFMPTEVQPISDDFQPTPVAPEPTFSPAPTPMPAPEPISEPTPMQVGPQSNLNTHQIKEAALRDLIPLLGRLNMTPSQKFDICRSIFEDLRDYSVLEQAYRAAVEIPNETKRAEALLYLVESINKM